MDNELIEKLDFAKMGLSDALLENLNQLNYTKPTLIQTKIIPLFLEGKDIVACSKTGSGKTAAYMIPLINKLKAHSGLIGTRALILIPSRELALQTSKCIRELIRGTDLKYAIVIGGHDYEGQFDSLASNPDILIATPGRVMEILQETKFTLTKVEYLIIDEADALFEMGFATQIREILKRVSTKRQTMLLSATIPAELSQFASSGLRDFALVKIDSEYKLPDKALIHFFLCRPEEKISFLLYLLQRVIPEGEKCLIFVSTRFWGDYIALLLPFFDIVASAINGKMHQEERDERMAFFAKKDTRAMIVTDLAARGLDLPFVKNVINFDYPQNAKSFIHRCGRTARADRHGSIYAIFTHSERMYFGQVKSRVDRTFQTEADPNGKYQYGHIYYGRVPENILSSAQEIIFKLLRDRQEVSDALTTAKNSSEKFEKSREKADSVAKRTFKDFDFSAYHPLFRHLVEADNIRMISEMKSYKPKMSHFGYEQARKENKTDIMKLSRNLEHMCKDFQSRKARRTAEKLENEKEELEHLQNNFNEPNEEEIAEDQEVSYSDQETEQPLQEYDVVHPDESQRRAQ